jgi:NTE family protein
MAARRGRGGKRIDLALQGGGSHGALTWGVLDKLLEDGRLRVSALSGTSAGAMNAVVLADGYERGGPDGAREALATFWKAVSDAARLSPIQRTPWDKLRGNYSLDTSPGYLFMDNLSRVFSPYDLNPANLNPLRDILERLVDFGNVNRRRQVQVFVTATNVRTGRPRIFGQGDVTVDSVLASACLPQMFPAVEIDGEAYWDGGFAGNPALYPLINNRASQDIVVVQINPIVRRTLPRSARDILNRVNEISFNSSLIKELRAIAMTQRLADEAGFDLGSRRNFLHIIHAEEEVQDLDASSKLNAEWDYLKLLFERGRGWADAWLTAHFDDIGQRSTLDLDEIFEDAPRPPAELPVAAPAGETDTGD